MVRFFSALHPPWAFGLDQPDQRLQLAMLGRCGAAVHAGAGAGGYPGVLRAAISSLRNVAMSVFTWAHSSASFPLAFALAPALWSNSSTVLTAPVSVMIFESMGRS
eukprot:scaffold16728_cov31-Tisochrysis_lutea.AAC.1